METGRSNINVPGMSVQYTTNIDNYGTPPISTRTSPTIARTSPTIARSSPKTIELCISLFAVKYA